MSFSKFAKPLLLSLSVITVVACGGEEARPAAIAATGTTMPTPTLAPGLPTLPAPTPAATGTAVAAAPTEPLPTLTAVPTLTPLPSPTNTPLPVERIALAADGLHNGDYAQAITLLEANARQPDAFAFAQQVENLYSLAWSYLQEQRYQDALGALDQLAALAGAQAPAAAQFHRGQAYAALGDYTAAIAAYQEYVNANSDLGAYIYPRIADAYAAMGDAANAQSAHEAAVAAPAHRLTEIGNRQTLAQLYLNAQNYPAAITQYDAIRNLAVTEFTQGEMAYKAGYAELLAGNNEAAYGRFQQALSAYPRAYETYLGLVQLVEAGVPVAEFQRGLVNYHAQSYEPAIAAFARYVAANPESYDPEAHLYAARSYEALGNLAAALAELELYAGADAAAATVERGRMLARAGDRPGALENYQFYVHNYPAGAEAAFAAWWSAVYTAGQGDIPTAIARFTALADAYPAYENTPEALFRAARLANESGDVDTAVALWQRLSQQYPAHPYGAAGLVWLLRTLPGYQPLAAVEGSAPPDPQAMLASARQLALSSTAGHYYALRARDIVAEMEPFTADTPIQLPTPEETAVAQAEAEQWLRAWLGLATEADVRTLAPALANDPRLIRGEKLWQLGLYQEAKRELEAVREAYLGDALSSYQLALYLRDLGLYRSSILAAARLPALSGQSVLALPPFIGRLMFPVYYADLVLPLARQYGYDPRLQFALLRQESLFESFATSSAVAQGLSQVIPDTGAYIAQRLNWPNFKNEDLYKPYVGVQFGAYYLDQQLTYFDGDVHAALSAYNAGPGNAARWHEQAGSDRSDLDVYVETVNFSETRTYIERIYEGFVIYRHLYGE